MELFTGIATGKEWEEQFQKCQVTYRNCSGKTVLSDLSGVVLMPDDFPSLEPKRKDRVLSSNMTHQEEFF